MQLQGFAKRRSRHTYLFDLGLSSERRIQLGLFLLVPPPVARLLQPGALHLLLGLLLATMAASSSASAAGSGLYEK